MRLSPRTPLVTRDGTLLKGAKMVNAVGVKTATKEYIETRPGLASVATFQGGGQGISDFNGTPISVFNGTVHSGLVSSGIICSVAGSVDYCKLSNDGIIWTTSNLPMAVNSSPVMCYGAGKFCILWLDNVLVSVDGVVWEHHSLPYEGVWQTVAWNGSIFCAVESTTNVIVISSDGITWTQHALPVTVVSPRITAKGSLFCLVAYNSTSSYTSTDGINWSGHAMPNGWSTWQAVVATDTMFIAFSDVLAFPLSDGEYYATSIDDGNTWVLQSTLPITDVKAACWSGSILCVFREGPLVTYTSTDGINWSGPGTSLSSPARLVWTGTVFLFTYINSWFTATSTDGLTWNQYSDPFSVRGYATAASLGSGTLGSVTGSFFDFAQGTP